MKELFEKLYTQNKESVEKKVETVIRTDIETEEATKILHLSPSLVLVKKENSEKGVKYTARLSYFIVYIKDGKIKKKECATEFNGFFESKGVLEDISLELLKTSTDTYGGDLKILSNLLVKATFLVENEKPFLTSSEDLIVKTDSLTRTKRVGFTTKSWEIEEDFDLNFSVEEVLLYNVNYQIKRVNSGVDAIILDGEALLSLSLLQKVENSDILKERRVIPFRVELEIEGALPEMVARAKMENGGVKIEALVDENTGKTTVNLKLSVNLYAEAFEEESLSKVIDCFSKTKEIELKKETIFLTRPLEKREESLRLNTKCNLEKDLTARLMSVADERFLLLTVEEDGTVNGLVELTAFLKGEELESILLTAPITFKVEKTDKEKLCYINACVENVYAKPLSLREVEVDLSLNLNYFLEETYEERLKKFL